MPTTGEKPGKGTYQCTNCDIILRLNDDSDRLPPCPNKDCNNTEYNLV